MPRESGSNARATVLTATLSAAPAPLDIEAMIAPAPVRLRVRYHRPSLDVPYFLYRIFADGSIVPMHVEERRPPAGRCARVSRAPAGRRRTSRRDGGAPWRL